MSKILIIVEPTDQIAIVESLLTAAERMHSPIDLCMLGHNSSQLAQFISHPRINTIYTTSEYDGPITVMDLILTCENILEDASTIIMSATSFGRTCLPYIAGKLDIAPITDVIEVIDNKTFRRPIYAGNAIETVENHQAKNLLTIRTTSFRPSTETGGQPKVSSLTVKKSPSVSAKDNTATATDRPDLISADIVVSGGAGVGSESDFSLIESLAESLGAAIGASRAAVDAGFVPNDYQVGQTGKIIAPGIYIAVGISGAIQHLAGMKDSQIIIAINQDPDAPIFKVSDIGYCGDLFDAIPRMIESIKKQKNN